MREAQAAARARRLGHGVEARALRGRRVGRPEARAELDVEHAGPREAGGRVGEHEVRRRAQREALEPEGLLLGVVDLLRRTVRCRASPPATALFWSARAAVAARRPPAPRHQGGLVRRLGRDRRRRRRRGRAARARGCPGGAASGRRGAGAAARHPRRRSPRRPCRA